MWKLKKRDTPISTYIEIFGKQNDTRWVLLRGQLKINDYFKKGINCRYKLDDHVVIITRYKK